MTSKANTTRTAASLFAAAALTGLAAPAALADPPQGHRVNASPGLVERIVMSERAASIDRAQTPIRPDDRAGARPVAISKTRPPIATVGSDGFEWSDATIGAGFTLALFLVAGGLALTIRQRRRLAVS